MRIAFLNSPRLANGQTVEAEDCCWGRVTRVLPSMLLSCATAVNEDFYNQARYLDPSIPGETLAVQDYMPDVIVYALAWQYHKEVHDIFVRLFPDSHHVILAVPPGYVSAYEELEPRPMAVLGGQPETMMHFFPKDAHNAVDWREFNRLSKGGLYCKGNQFHKLGPINYDLVPVRYWPHYTSAVYQISRGCPYRCHFCVWGGSTVTDPTFRMRSASPVAGNLKQLRDLSSRYRDAPLPLYLLAAQLTTSLGWLREFSDYMTITGDPYPFQSNVNLGEVTLEKVQLLKKAGMGSVSAGLEATSNRTLKMIGKPYTLDRAIDSILILQDNFRTVRLHVRTGFGEDAYDVLDAIEGLKRMKERGVRKPRIDMAPLVHYRGTAIRDNADYPLEQLDDYDVESLVMAKQPIKAWRLYAEELKSYGWFTKWGLSK